MGFFRHFLPVAAAAAVGAALVYAAEKLVEKQEDEHIVDPDAFDDFDPYDEDGDSAANAESAADSTEATATITPEPEACDCACDCDKAETSPEACGCACDKADAAPADCGCACDEPATETTGEPAAPEADSAPAAPYEPAVCGTPAEAAAPNVNPVRDEAEPTPVTEDGKIDVEKLASPADFGNWDDLGCQG